jgi:hypothetical protein
MTTLVMADGSTVDGMRDVEHYTNALFVFREASSIVVCARDGSCIDVVPRDVVDVLP